MPEQGLAKPQTLEDKENTPYEPPEKKLKKHSSTGFEGMENPIPECGISQSYRLAERKKQRQLAARQFRSGYTYGLTTFVDGCKKRVGHAKDRKFGLWSCGGKSSWLNKSSGIMWVAVHGMDSICVVTKDEKLDKIRVGGVLKGMSEMEVLHLFRETVISEMEELADPSSEPVYFYAYNAIRRKPFGVVSVTEGYDKFHAECSHEAPSSADFDKVKAVEFLQEKMKSSLAFTYNETIQTAISAFQQLFHRNFNANGIQVCAWKCDDDDVALELPWCDIKKFIAAE